MGTNWYQKPTTKKTRMSSVSQLAHLHEQSEYTSECQWNRCSTSPKHQTTFDQTVFVSTPITAFRLSFSQAAGKRQHLLVAPAICSQQSLNVANVSTSKVGNFQVAFAPTWSSKVLKGKNKKNKETPGLCKSRASPKIRSLSVAFEQIAISLLHSHQVHQHNKQWSDERKHRMLAREWEEIERRQTHYCVTTKLK